MLKAGDLVFAKVKGWWPWPARLMCRVSPRQYKVFFYGTRQESLVQVDCIWPVHDKLDSFTRKYGGHQDYVFALQEIKINPDIFAVHDDDLCGHKCMTCDIKRKRQQLKVGSNSQSNEDRDVNGSAEKSTKSIKKVVKMSSNKHTSEVWLVPKFSGINVNSEEGIETGMKFTKVNKSRDIKSSKIKNDESHRFGLKQNLDLTKIVSHEESSDNQKAVSKYMPPQMVKRRRSNSPNQEVKMAQKESKKRKKKMLSKMAKQRKLDGTHSIITKIGYPIKKTQLEVRTKPDTSCVTNKAQVNKKKLDTIVISECNEIEKFNESEYMESEPSKKPDKTCGLNQFGIDGNEASQDNIFKGIEYPERETDKVLVCELEKPKVKLTRIKGCAEVRTVTKCKYKLGVGLSSKKNDTTSRLANLFVKNIRNSSKKSDQTDHSESGRDDEPLFEQDIRSSSRKSDKTVHSKLDKEAENLLKKDIRSLKESDETGYSSNEREEKHLFEKDIRSPKQKCHKTKHSKSREDGNLFKMDIGRYKKSDKADHSKGGRDDKSPFEQDIRSSPRKSDKTDHSKIAREDENLFKRDISSSPKKADGTGHSKTFREDKTMLEKDIRSSKKKSDETELLEDKSVFEKYIRSPKKKSDETVVSKSDGKDLNLFKMGIRSSPSKFDKTDHSKSGREDENSFEKVIRSSSKIDNSKTDRDKAQQENYSEFKTKLISKNKNNCTEIQAVNSNYDNKNRTNGIENQQSDSRSRNGDNFIASFRLDIHEIINAEEEEDALEMEVSYGLLETSNESEIEDEGVREENILERDLALTDDSSEEEDTKPLSPI